MSDTSIITRLVTIRDDANATRVPVALAQSAFSSAERGTFTLATLARVVQARGIVGNGGENVDNLTALARLFLAGTPQADDAQAVKSRRSRFSALASAYSNVEATECDVTAATYAAALYVYDLGKAARDAVAPHLAAVKALDDADAKAAAWQDLRGIAFKAAKAAKAPAKAPAPAPGTPDDEGGDEGSGDSREPRPNLGTDAKMTAGAWVKDLERLHTMAQGPDGVGSAFALTTAQAAIVAEILEAIAALVVGEPVAAE